jgi:hypothetical protein
MNAARDRGLKTSRNVYLSDGGHIENLGVYELLALVKAHRENKLCLHVASASGTFLAVYGSDFVRETSIRILAGSLPFGWPTGV